MVREMEMGIEMEREGDADTYSRRKMEIKR
jgi:hypothetical protein